MMRFEDLPAERRKVILSDYRKAMRKANIWINARLRAPMSNKTPYAMMSGEARKGIL